MKNSTQLYKELTESIILMLEEQQLSWNKPWICLDDFGGMARNASTGRMYSIVNQILLGFTLKKQKYPKNAWLTYKQITELGGKIKKDEKSSTIYFNTFTWKDKDGKKYSLEELKKLSKKEKEELEIKSSYFLTAYLVFNVAQTMDLPEIYYDLPSKHHTVRFKVDDVVENLIEHHAETFDLSLNPIDSAYYNVQDDTVVLPTLEQFNSPDAFYCTLFHEWIHWTGHPSRLNRVTLNERSDENYALEELIAELGSVFICAQLGLVKNISQNAAYIQSWLKALKDDNRYIMKAVSQAEKGCRFILKDFNLEEELQGYEEQVIE